MMADLKSCSVVDFLEGVPTNEAGMFLLSSSFIIANVRAISHPAPVQAEQGLEVVADLSINREEGFDLLLTATIAGMCLRDGHYQLTDHAKATAALAQKDAEIAMLVAERNLAWSMCDQLRATNAAQAEQLAAMTTALNKAKTCINIVWVSHHANRCDDALESIDRALLQSIPTEPQVGVELPELPKAVGRVMIVEGEESCGDLRVKLPENTRLFSTQQMQDYARCALNQRQAVKAEPIERHADNWADVGLMMDEFVQAQLAILQSIPTEPQVGVELTDGANGWHEYHSLGPIRRYMLDCHMDGMDHFAEFVLASDHDSRVHDLEALCDPAGITAENALLRDQTRMLDAMIKRLKDEISDHEKAYELLFKENALNQRQAVKAEPIGRGVYLMDDKYEEAITELAAEKDLTNLQIIKQALKLYQMHEKKFFAEPATTKPEPLSAAHGVPEGWLPIETAPTDGTVILALECWIYHTDAARRPHYILREVFYNDEGGWEIVEDGEVREDDGFTHWLPRTRLPATPAAQKEVGK